LISIQRSYHDGKTRLQKSFFILLIVALMSATAAIGFKYALEKMSFWNVYSLVGISTAIVVFHCLSAQSEFEGIVEFATADAKNSVRRRRPVPRDYLRCLAFKAMGLGQISSLTRFSIFVGFCLYLLSDSGLAVPKVINDRIDKGTIFYQGNCYRHDHGGIIMITSGDTIINLFKGWFHLS